MLKKLIDRFPIGTVLLLMLLTLSPMMALRDYTPSNELRYISIVDEALQDGHILAFTNQGEDYADKPPLYFWLMMLLKKLLGDHCMYALSLLSFIPACVIIVVMDKWLRSAFPESFTARKRAGAALMLATTGLFLGMTVFLRMDMLMCMWIVLALWTFWKWDNGMGREGACRFLLPVYTFLAVLCGIWFTGVYLEGGAGYLRNLLFHQTVDRAVNSFHHKAPFWYYLAMVWAVMAPWCLATVPAMVSALFRKRDCEAPSGYEKTLALTSISAFVMLSIFSSKLAIYLAPIFPFAVYLWPAVVRRKGWNGWNSLAVTMPAILSLVLGILAAAVSFACLLIPKLPEFISFPFLESPFIMLAGAMLALGGIMALRASSKEREAWEKPVIIVSLAMLSSIFLVSFKMPAVNDYIGYANVCKLVPAEGQVYTLKVRRPGSMDVYLGRDIYDFGNDTESLLFLAPEEGTLILPVKALGESEALGEFVEDFDVQYCGPYAVYNLEPKKSQPAPRRRQRRSR